MKSDARKLSTEEQYLLRIRAVDMYFKHNITQRQIANLLCISRQHINKWCKAFEENGYEGLEMGIRGRRAQEQIALQHLQCARIVNIIRARTPEQAPICTLGTSHC